MGRVDSYNTTPAEAVAQLSALGLTSRVHVVAAGTQFDLTGSDAGNSAFIITGTPNAGTILTFADGSSATAAAAFVKDTEFKYTLSKIVTVTNTVVVLWK